MRKGEAKNQMEWSPGVSFCEDRSSVAGILEKPVGFSLSGISELTEDSNVCMFKECGI